MKNLIIIIYAFLCFQINCCCLGSRAIDPNFKLNHEQISDEQAFEQAVKNHDFYSICLHRSKKAKDQGSPENSFCQLEQGMIDEIFNDIHAKILDQRRENPNQYIFVLFSECFFGENEPLNNKQASYLIKKCRFLTRKRRVMLQVSMLHKFNVNKLPYWLKGKYKPVKSRKEIRERIVNSDGNTGYINEKERAKYFLKADKKHPDRIANYTITMIDGKIVAIYRKSTYCREADKYINTTYETAKYAYEFGDFCAHAVEDSPFAKFFIGKNPPVATRMCSDMNAKYLKYNYPAELVLLHANDRPTIYGEIFQNFIFCIDDTKDLALIFPNNQRSGISGEDIREINGCVRCGFDFSVLLNPSDEIIPIKHIQYEIN